MKTVLVIDDERDVLDVVRSVLKAKAYRVVIAEGGEEGLRRAEEVRPDLIITDMMMPKISGLEVIKRLKRDDELKKIPIMVLSAMGTDDERPAEFWIQGLGVDDYVSKPFDPLDLLGRVEYIFRRGDYVSNQAGRQASQFETVDEEGIPEAMPLVDLTTSPPDEVARVYVESWNRRDFVTEFQTLAEELHGGLKQDEYVASRLSAYSAQKGHLHEQNLQEIISTNISGFIAKVIAQRYDVHEGHGEKKQATLTLKKTNRGWKIIRYTETAMT